MELVQELKEAAQRLTTTARSVTVCVCAFIKNLPWKKVCKAMSKSFAVIFAFFGGILVILAKLHSLIDCEQDDVIEEAEFNSFGVDRETAETVGKDWMQVTPEEAYGKI